MTAFFEKIYSFLLSLGNTLEGYLPEVLTDYTKIIGIVLACFFLFVCFFGKKLTTPIMRVLFFIVGVVFGKFVYTLIPVEALQNFTWGGWILGIILGVVLAITTKQVFNYILFVAITGACCRFLTEPLANLINSDKITSIPAETIEQLQYFLPIALGILASFIFVYLLLPLFMILLTSVGGSVCTVSALLLSFETKFTAAFGDSLQMVITIVCIILALLSIVVQTIVYENAKKKEKEED